MRYTKVGVLAATALLGFSACSGSATTAPSQSAAASSGGGATAAPSSSSGGGTGNCTVNIATELPMQGSELAASQPIVNGVKLAISQHGAETGCTVNFPDSAQFDDALNGAHDPQTGAKNMTTITSDPSYMAVIGPVNSSVAVPDSITKAKSVTGCGWVE